MLSLNMLRDNILSVLHISQTFSLFILFFLNFESLKIKCVLFSNLPYFLKERNPMKLSISKQQFLTIFSVLFFNMQVFFIGFACIVCIWMFVSINQQFTR